MFEIKILNLINNWPINILNDYLEYSDPEEITEDEKYSSNGKIIETKILKINSEKKDLKKNISLELFSLIKKDWPDKKICIYCFSNSVEFHQVSEEFFFIKCKKCNKLYEYLYNWDFIPLPNENFFYITDTHNNPFEFKNSFDININDFINLENFDYFKLKNDFFDELKNKTLNKGIPKHIFLENKEKNLKVFYFPDFFHLIDKFNVSDKIKDVFTKLFWNVNFSEYKKIYNEILTGNSNGFIDLNNETFENFKILTKTKTFEMEFEKVKEIDISKLKNIKKSFNKISIIKNISNENKIINLLNIFHQFELTTEIPFCSLYISKIDSYKYKILRSLPYDIYKEWVNNYYKFYHITDKSLNFKIHFLNDLFITFKLYENGMLKILIPFNQDFSKKDLEILIKKINNEIILKIKELHYKIMFADRELELLEDIDLLDLNFNYNISFDTSFNIDSTLFYKLLNIMTDHVIVEKFVDNSIFLNYIFNIENKQELQYQYWLNTNLKKFIKYGEKSKYLDIINLKSIFGSTFDLDKNYVDVVFDNWEEKNKTQIELFVNGKLNFQKFNQFNIRTIIKLFFDEKFLRIQIYGINKLEIKKNIFIFFKKILNLYENLDHFEFFKSKIKTQTIKIENKKKEKDLKLSLRRFLPEIFWEPDRSNPEDKGFTRYCQKKEQPLIFSDKFEYEEYIKKNDVKNKTEIQKDFDLNIESKSLNDLDKKLEKFDIKISENTNKFLKNIILMKKLIDLNENLYTDKELIDITKNLGLSTIYKRNIMIRNIKRFLNLQEELAKIGKYVYPRPNTFIINKNQQDYFLVCPGLDSERKFLGFIDLEKHPKFSEAPNNEKSNYCVPCCKKTFNDSNIDFCSGTIDYDEYLNNLTLKSDYIKNDKKVPLEIFRYGFLDKNLYKLFNKDLKKENLLSEFQNPVFLRYGVNSINSFIYSIMVCLDINNIQVFKKKLSNISLDTFKTLNDGNLYFKYSYETFLNLIETDLNIFNFQDLWELCSFVNDINILIFENRIINNTEKLFLVCPENQEINYFFKENKKTIFIVKNNVFFEPIVKYYTPKKQEKKFNISDDFFKGITDLYKESCKIHNQSSLTVKNLFLTFNDRIKYQYINEFNKIQYVMIDNIIIPTIPCGAIREIEIKNSKNIKFKNFNKTINFINENLNVIINIFVDNEKIKYIILDKTLILPIEEKKISDTDKKDYEIINTFIDYREIDDNILKKINDNFFNQSNNKIIDRELYEVFKILFSNFLTKTDIIEMKKKIDIKSEKEIIKKFIEKKVKIINLEHFELLINKFQIKNIRTTKDNIFIENGKIILYSSKLKEYIKKLEYELFKLITKRNLILEKSFNIVIDDLLFVNEKKYFFI